MKKLILFLFLLLSIGVYGQSDQQQIQLKIQSISALNIENLRYTCATAMVQSDRLLFIGMNQDTIIKKLNERIETLEEENKRKLTLLNNLLQAMIETLSFKDFHTVSELYHQLNRKTGVED